MTIPRYHVTKLLKDYRCDQDEDYLGHEVWVSPPPDNVPIQIPPGISIDYDIVEMIALEQLNLSNWEFDYWLGQIGFALN
ncbi:MAG: hypothetical protein KBH03_08000 [Paludibacteraceae bacterium]|jgi:hypothetical protein|nr:hypothetical protein [Paludibacteraceae bacterium]